VFNGANITVNNPEKMTGEDLRRGNPSPPHRSNFLIINEILAILGSKWVLVSQIFFMSSLWATKASMVGSAFPTEVAYLLNL
jgi:hypothetical protein